MPDAHAARLAASLDTTDPAEAGAAGDAFLTHLREEGGATEDTIGLAAGLISFATARQPDHPDAPMWSFQAGSAYSFLYNETDSPDHLRTAIGFMTFAARGIDQAAGHTAELVRLLIMITGEDLAPEEARRWTTELDRLAPAAPTHEFLREQAFAHRWAYPVTLDPQDLDRAVAGLEKVLPHEHENRALVLEQLAVLQEERHRLTEDPALLDAAIAAALELRTELAGDENLPRAQAQLAGLLSTRCWLTQNEDDRDAAIAAYEVARELDVEEAADHGVLLCVRGEDKERPADLHAGIEILANAAVRPGGWTWPVLSVLTEANVVLTRLEGPEHAWPVIYWATDALTAAPEHTSASTTMRACRLEAIAFAGKEFGIAEVMARHDVRAILDDAEAAIRATADDPEPRATLVLRYAHVRLQWPGELAAPGEDPRVAVRNLRALVDESKPSLPAEHHETLNQLCGWLDAMMLPFEAEANPVPGLMRILDGFTTDDGSPEGLVEAAMVKLLHKLTTAGSGTDIAALSGHITALLWRVDELEPSERKERLEGPLALLSQVVGPGIGADPTLMRQRFDTQDDSGLGNLLSRVDAWRTALSSGDTGLALAAYEAVDRVAAAIPAGHPTELMARMVHSTCRSQLSALVPVEPAALDADIAALEQQNAPVELGFRLRLRDRPGDRAASRALGITAARRFGDRVTAWCLDDGAHDDLVRVLEARRQVSLGTSLHHGPDEIRKSLRADVLIYLVPRCDAHEGMAVAVPKDGPVRVIALPELRTGTLNARGDLRHVGGSAWAAAGDAFTPWPGKRLALVPMGDLGLVPWAAAWREVDGIRRYLVQDNEITLLPAAGLRDFTHHPRGALFVANPNRDNDAAAIAAVSLRDTFHPDGRFLGGHGQPPRPWRPSPQGPGTPEEVRAAIRAGLAVLHLGCRTTSDLDDQRRSSISLHNGTLAVSELLPAQLGLVTLTDHTTSGSGHDNARTLPAMFLAHGTGSVLATQWPGDSAPLVRLVHHHIGQGLSPSAALRAAQLWLLDPHRTPIAGMTPPPDPTAPEHWASLTHHGR